MEILVKLLSNNVMLLVLLVVDSKILLLVLLANLVISLVRMVDVKHAAAIVLNV